MIKTKRQMFIVIGVFALVMMLGTVTYAFFNYTRTGSANNIKTGRIYFNADGGNNIVTLSDLFPISLEENETVTASTPGVGSLKLHITGDTTYTDGVEYLIEAVEVTGNGQTALPISIDISYAATEAEQNQPANDIGQADENYFTNRGGSTSRYKLLSTGSISEGEDILVGYIAHGNTGIDGELTILAYLDADNIAITDTYPEGTKREVVTGYNTSACETALEGDQTAQALCSDGDDLQGALDNNDLTNNQINALLNAGVITEYTDGTTSEWVHGRTVFTTEEWNALQATGVSFKIKATAQEGIWVTQAPICKRATTLHTEKCTNTDSTSYYCQADGYQLNADITYGNLGTNGGNIATGDAFDCDVNGDGNYTERFYYISDYFDTSTKSFDNTYATLVYYSSVYNGEASTELSYYTSVEDAQEISGNPSLYTVNNLYGPVTAAKQMPSTTSWSNVSLKQDTRAILAEKEDVHNSSSTSWGQLISNFSYEGKAARLLTAQEIMRGCNISEVISSNSTPFNSNCRFLLEGTRYSGVNSSQWYQVLETVNYVEEAQVAVINNGGREIGSQRAQTSVGVRPAIDVPYSRIEK